LISAPLLTVWPIASGRSVWDCFEMRLLREIFRAQPAVC
jgi:hypothetical protein